MGHRNTLSGPRPAGPGGGKCPRVGIAGGRVVKKKKRRRVPECVPHGASPFLPSVASPATPAFRPKQQWVLVVRLGGLFHAKHWAAGRVDRS